MPTDFPSCLRYLRQVRGWSQQELVDQISALCYRDGEECTLGAKTIGRWETGARLPQPRYRKRLCQLFGLSTRQLGILKRRRDRA